MELLLINKVKTNRIEFQEKVKLIANKLKINPNWLMLVMNAESKLNHKAVNPIGATGLIQFIPSTAKQLGTTTRDLYNMTNVEQLDYVYKYFTPYIGKMKSYYDVYLATFFPAAIGKPDNWIFSTKKLSAAKIAKQNPAINLNKDSKITISEFKQYVNNTIPKKLPDSGNSKTKDNTILPAIIALAVISFFMIK